MNKYRVTFRTFKEYVSYGGQTTNTNVHLIMECDVVAEHAADALTFAGQAFGDIAKQSGDWKVRCMACGGSMPTHHTGSPASNSTLVCVSHMGH